MVLNCTADGRVASRRGAFIHGASAFLPLRITPVRTPSHWKAEPGPLSALLLVLFRRFARRCHRWRYWNYIGSTKGWGKTFINAYNASIVLPRKIDPCWFSERTPWKHKTRYVFEIVGCSYYYGAVYIGNKLRKLFILKKGVTYQRDKGSLFRNVPKYDMYVTWFLWIYGVPYWLEDQIWITI